MLHKSLLLSLFLLFITTFANVDSLIRVGISHHDKGNYDLAISAYSEALKLEPKSALGHYEIAMTYMYSGKPKKALKHINKVFKYDSGQYHLAAYICKGSCLDNLGRTNESIELFEKALKEYGANVMLNYNLALNYYKLKNLTKSEKILVEGIKKDATHASSHLLLSYIKGDQGKKVEAMLSIYYFLLLEPHTQRSKDAFTALNQYFKSNISKNDKSTTITIQPGESGMEDLMLSILESASEIKDGELYEGLTVFEKKTKGLFEILSEKMVESKSVFTEVHIPLFTKLSKSEHFQTYCNYISFTSLDESSKWLRENRDKVESFSVWVNQL